jgi:hypothetical protein
MGENQALLACRDCFLKYEAKELSLCGCGEVICSKCRNKVMHVFHGSAEEAAYARERKFLTNRRLSKFLKLQTVANFFAPVNIHILLSCLYKYLPHMVISKHDTGVVDNTQLVWWEVSNRPVDYYKHGLSKVFYGRTINEALIFALLHHLDQE